MRPAPLLTQVQDAEEVKELIAEYDIVEKILGIAEGQGTSWVGRRDNFCFKTLINIYKTVSCIDLCALPSLVLCLLRVPRG